MSEETRRVAFACAVGAFIGSVVSLEAASRLGISGAIWVIGAVMGGLVGYVAYDIKAVYRAVGRVLGEAPGFLSGCAALLVSFISAVVLTFSVFVLLFAGASFAGDGNALLGDGLRIIMIRLTLFFGLIIVLCTQIALAQQHEASVRAYMWGVARCLRYCALKYNVVALPFTLLYLLGRSLKKIPRILFHTLLIAVSIVLLPFILAKKVFLLIHSTERNVCLADAAIGAMIGYWTGSPLIGALAGVVLGVMNYELISIRLLGLPRRVS